MVIFHSYVSLPEGNPDFLDIYPIKIRNSISEEIQPTLLVIYPTKKMCFTKIDLVGGARTILKNMRSSTGRMTSHIWNGKLNSCLKPPTPLKK
jgi:hypothetical protein